MSTAAVVLHEANSPATPDLRIVRLREARTQLATATPETLSEIIVWADAVSAAAKVKRASHVFREAAETRIRAERRLGELLAADRTLAHRLTLPATGISQYETLGRVPKRLFERSVRDLVDREKGCSTFHVIENTRKASLQQVEPGIWRAWDDTFYIQRGLTTGGSPTTRRNRVHGGIAEAREELRYAAGLKKTWRKDPVTDGIDDAHARARRLAQGLSILGSTAALTGESRKLVAEAELLQAKVAEILFRAYSSSITNREPS